jgi:hypothetical protein
MTSHDADVPVDIRSGTGRVAATRGRIILRSCQTDGWSTGFVAAARDVARLGVRHSFVATAAPPTLSGRVGVAGAGRRRTG